MKHSIKSASAPIYMLIAIQTIVITTMIGAPSRVFAQSIKLQCAISWLDSSNRLRGTISKPFSASEPIDSYNGTQVSEFRNYFDQIHPNANLAGVFICHDITHNPDQKGGPGLDSNGYLWEEIDWPPRAGQPQIANKFNQVMCFVAGWKSTEDQGGGVYPNYIYESAPFTAPRSSLIIIARKFANAVDVQYGFDENHNHLLNKRKAFCYSGDLASKAQAYISNIRQDGGVASIQEVPTGWTPRH